jgi:hypothetical protein
MYRRCATLVLVAGALTLGASASAQDQPAPPPSDQPPPQAGAPSLDDRGASPPLTPAVQAQSLDQLDLFSAGRDTGLGADLWKDASAAIAKSVIPALAEKPLSPAGVALARRVLATAATAPEGAGRDLDLAKDRVKALMALGDAAAVDSILDRTPNLGADPDLSQIAAEAALITDQPDKACRISDVLQSGRHGVYWIRLRGYCQARAGKSAEAQLTLSLAAQEHADGDYLRLMNAVVAGAGDPGAPSLRDGIDFALTRQLKLDPRPALAGAPVAIGERVSALPAASAQGAPSPDPAALASESDVLAALHAAKTPADYRFIAEAQSPAIAGLVRNHAPLTAPVQLAAASLIAGDLVTAQAIRASLTQDSIAGATNVDLAIIDAALAVALGKPDPETLDRLAERGEAVQGPAKAKAQSAAAIFAPFAGASSPATRSDIADFDLAAPAGAPAQALALELAADAKARGDVALLALSLAQAGGAAGPDPVARARLERALDRAGFAPESRGFAIEGLVEIERP